MDGWVIFLIIILVIVVIFVIIFLVLFFRHGDNIGQTCTAQRDCSSGLVCVNTGTSSAPAYTCQGGYQAPCTGGTASKDCAPTLTCNSSGVCVPLPTTTTTTTTTNNNNFNGASGNRTCRGNNNTTTTTGNRAKVAWHGPRLPGQFHNRPPNQNTSKSVINSNTLVTEKPRSVVIDDSLADSVTETAGEAVCLDMCSFSNMTLALYSNGRIVAQAHGEASRYVDNNVRLKRIFSYNRYLTGLTVDGVIVWLEPSQVPLERWEWKRYDGLPNRITSCSVTLDQEHLWLHDATQNRGYLYREHNLVEQVDHYGYRRVYGNNLKIYAEIDDHKHEAKIYPTGQTFTDVHDIAIAYPDKITVLKNSDLHQYRAVAIVNWVAMYINA